MPYGLVASNGMVYTSLPEGLPSLVVYNDGGVEIRSDFNVNDIATARFVLSGSKLLVSEGKKVNKDSDIDTKDNKKCNRIGIGILKDGRLLLIHNECTTEELQMIFYEYNIWDAMMTTIDDVFIDYPRGGVKMGTAPVTVLEALDFKELPHPIVVIDPGHGGKDPGASAFGLREKDLNLIGARIVYNYLVENYEGTFLMTRDSDSTMKLEDRPMYANTMGADFFLSLHVNAAGGEGYETFTYIGKEPINLIEQEIQNKVHKDVMTFLAPHGIIDRGAKQANFCVLRKSDCPALLVENLFIDNLKDNDFLQDVNLFKNLYLVTAKAYAQAIGLQPKVSEDDVAPDGQLYRVQVGAYRFKKNAEVVQARLQSAGFDAYIKRE